MTIDEATRVLEDLRNANRLGTFGITVLMETRVIFPKRHPLHNRVVKRTTIRNARIACETATASDTHSGRTFTRIGSRPYLYEFNGSVYMRIAFGATTTTESEYFVDGEPANEFWKPQISKREEDINKGVRPSEIFPHIENIRKIRFGNILTTARDDSPYTTK